MANKYDEYEKANLEEMTSGELIALLDDLVQLMTNSNNVEWVNHQGQKAFNKLKREIAERLP